MANIYFKIANLCIQEKYNKNYASNFNLEIVEEYSRIKEQTQTGANIIVENNPIDYIKSGESLKLFVYNKIMQISC